MLRTRYKTLAIAFMIANGDDVVRLENKLLEESCLNSKSTTWPSSWPRWPPVFIGAIWYSPLMFHKAWVKAHGHSEEKIADMRKTAGKAFLVSLPCYMVMALVLSVFALYTDSITSMQGVSLGFLVWIGVFATLGLTAHMFSEKPLSTYLLDAGYQLVYLLTMGATVAVWR